MGVARFVCEALVRHLNFFDNVLVWSENLDLVQEIVGGVHYKGCRDIMKLLFDKFDHLPRDIPEDGVVALLKGQKVSCTKTLCKWDIYNSLICVAPGIHS